MANAITRFHAKYYAALLNGQSANGDIGSLSQSLLSSTVDINPHQIDAALFAFASPFSKGVVLADEVGLGKTIEAGLVVCQYWATGKRKILIVCPASLRKQWEAELLDKFGIPSEILDTKNFNVYRREGKNPLSPKRAIICSYNFVAKHKENILLHGFDLAVIDEAHKMRNVYRTSARTSAEVRDALTGVKKLLLTATPFQNSLMELYGLTSIIDDRLFGSEKSFRRQYGKGENLKELRQRIEKLYTRTLRRDVKEYINYTHRLPLTQKFNATDEEQQLYQAVSDFLRRNDIYSVPAAQKKLTTMIVRKILASSTYALIYTLTHIKERLQRMLESQKQERLDIEDLVDEDDWESYEDEAAEGGNEEDELFDSDEIDIPRLKEEIKTIEGFIEKAKSIKSESKSKALLVALEESFTKLQEQGAERKALIFTESTKTQAFLREFLEANGYADRIVLFNGKASEPQTNEIYKRWCLEHPDKVSGIKAADRRAAAVDYFQHKADIMIATEAAAEGLNLQFCSLVINYDLPWNPQRIEQRIGRCHRYGQKYDVVVVNFLNMRNYADVRVFQLLSTKFKLFDDVFGASDEVLGQADTIDIESRIWEIYQQCRSEEEINQAFEQLQNEMQEQIDERMTEVRSQVLENFDINVQEHLRMTRDNTTGFLNRYEHIFWELTKYILSKEAVFNDNSHSFVLRVPVAGQRPGKYAMLQQTDDATPYRLSHPLAQHVINSALSLSLDDAEVEFDQKALSMNADLPDYLQGQSGVLILSSLAVSALAEEQYMLFNAITDDGRIVSQEDCEKLFLNGGKEMPCEQVEEQTRLRLQKDVLQHSAAKLKELDTRNLSFFKVEENRIYQWEHDVIDGIEAELSTIKKQILQTERDARNAESVAEKLALEKKVDELKRKKRRLRNELDDREEEVSQQRKSMITELEQRLVKQTEQQNLFVIRWKVKEYIDMAQNYYESFKKKLEEIFMMDHAELDFGIYRIMNQKRNDIQHFLDLELLPQVKQVLEGNNGGEADRAKKRMAEIAASVGGNIEVLPKGTPMRDEYDKLEAQLAQSADTESMQAEVFSHLVTFFSRYYDGGDFLSKRRYKDNTYAIPYNGEEVKLYWANSDQYYIKTSEYFRNYTFVLPTSRKKVHFVLKDASTEQNNNRAANNMERRFALFVPENDEPIVETTDEGELNIYFTYELMPKATKQKDLLTAALEAITPLVPTDFEEVLTAKAPTKDNPNRTLLEKHLTDYTAKNSFDYFIHKDLGGFLHRELDFYIKNEVLHIDDLDAQLINSQLTIVRAIKQVGEKIIRMLAQLENFQKKLWLKKKFVVQSDYCITLDRVPEKLYPEIIANEAQRKEWVRLFAIDEIKGDLTTEGYSEPLTIEFLKQNPFLVLDTAFFDAKFKHQLVKSMENVDEQTNGLLINSENFQALEFLQEKYRNRVQTIYADPPYNTSASEIMYKNSYKHSSWLSLLKDRLEAGRNLLKQSGIQCTTIDDVEQSKLSLLLSNVFEEDPEVVAIRIKPSGRPIPNGFAISHEYGLFSKKDETTAIARLSRSDEQLARYRERDDKGPFFWEMLRKAGSNSRRENRPTMYYPFYWDKAERTFRVPDMEYSDEQKCYIIKEEPLSSETVIYPIKDDGSEGCWYFGIENIKDHVASLKAEIQPSGITYVYYRRRPNEGVQPLTTWGDAKYSATEHGTDLLKKMAIPFDYPKSIHAVEDCLRVAGCHTSALVLDFFGGSGTTSHAVINLNKEDKGSRKYILCDMADYFDAALRARTMKAVYSCEWNNGKPVSRQGISQCFKYIRLEQYEDTLNNLEIKKQQTDWRDDEFHESYMLGYMLDTETRDSLLNLKMFVNPFNMSLKTTKDNELVETKVDMVETFNYLIGLNVETEDWFENDNICVVQGKTHRRGLKTLVIWRNCEEIDNEKLCRFFERMDFRTRDTEFDLIYVNGDNTLPNLRRDEENWKVVMIEEEFAKRMFEEA